jgi:hypothetical protein
MDKLFIRFCASGFSVTLASLGTAALFLLYAFLDSRRKERLRVIRWHSSELPFTLFPIICHTSQMASICLFRNIRMRTFAELQRLRVKRNGCSLPPHPLQAVAYLVVVSQGLVSATCMGPLFGDLAVSLTQLHFSLFSGFLQLAAALLGLVLTYSDPTDPAVYAYRKALVQG